METVGDGQKPHHASKAMKLLFKGSKYQDSNYFPGPIIDEEPGMLVITWTLWACDKA